MKNYGLQVETAGRNGFEVTRYGRRFWARTFNTRRTALAWLKRAVAECRIDPLAGVHFADSSIRARALRGAALEG